MPSRFSLSVMAVVPGLVVVTGQPRAMMFTEAVDLEQNTLPVSRRAQDRWDRTFAGDKGSNNPDGRIPIDHEVPEGTDVPFAIVGIQVCA